LNGKGAQKMNVHQCLIHTGCYKVNTFYNLLYREEWYKAYFRRTNVYIVLPFHVAMLNEARLERQKEKKRERERKEAQQSGY